MTVSPPILVLSHHGHAPPAFRPWLDAGRLVSLWEWELTEDGIAQAPGLLLTMHLDQTRAMSWLPALDAMLDRHGRILINGQVARPFISGLGGFVLCGRKREHYCLTVLGEHPVFEGVDRLSLEVRKGVAGFYGRGHNALPDGAQPLTGVGPEMAPIDWIWRRQAGGAVFSHAGNDLWGNTDDEAVRDRLIGNSINWLAQETEA